MPSLNLRNPLRRDPNRPTLKQRAVALKATAGRLIRKPKPLPAAGSPEAVEAFRIACQGVDAASRLSDAEMETLRIAPGSPTFWTSEKVQDALNGKFPRFLPQEIEAARATPRTRLRELQILTLRRELQMAEAAQRYRIHEVFALVYGDEPDLADEDEAPAAGEPDPIFALIEANRAAEAAMDAQSKTAPSTEADRAEIDAAETEQVRSWQAVYRTPPTTLAGLAALREWTMWQIERHREPPEGDGSVWADAYLSLYAALRLVLGPAEADPRLVAMVAEWQEQRRKHDDPAFCETPEAIATWPDHSRLQHEIYLYPARTPLDLLAKAPLFRDELADAVRGHDEPTEAMAGIAWTGLLADIERIAGAAPALVPANDAELIALGRAFDAAAARSWEAERAHEADRCNEKRIAADKAGEPVYELGERIAPLPAHTLAGMRVKLRLAAFYGTCLPRGSDSDEEEHNGEIAIRSLYQSTPGIVLGADRYSVRIVPEA